MSKRPVWPQAEQTRWRRRSPKIRLISHRSFGFHSPAPLIALIYLCCAGITIPLSR